MRLILFFCLLSLNLFSQNKRLAIDNELLPYVEELVNEAESRGWYSFKSKIVQHIKTIYIAKIERYQIDTITGDTFDFVDKVMGLSQQDKNSIVINKEYLNDTLLVKLTLWHEIGHHLKYNFFYLHSCVDCPDIMSEYFPDDMSIYKDKEFLQNRLDDYFKFIYTQYGLLPAFYTFKIKY